MTAAAWMTLFTVVFGGGGALTAILAWRKDARQGPIDRSTAQVADALAVSQAAAGWVQYQDEKMREQESRNVKQAEMNADLSRRVGRLETRLTGWGVWYDDLKYRWMEHREQDKPPDKPVD